MLSLLLPLLLPGELRAEDAPPVAEASGGWTATVAQPAAPDRSYRVGPGDTLEIQVYGEPTLSGTFPVNDAGQLEFPLLGALQVEGLSGPEVAYLLRQRLSAGYINEPNVTAWPASYNSQQVQIAGAVAKPGVYSLKGTTTVLEALSMAGGVNNEGVNEVRITNSEQEGEVVVLSYEQLQGAFDTHLPRIANFLDMDLDPELAALVSKQSSLAFMQAHGQHFDDHFLRLRRQSFLDVPADSSSSKVMAAGTPRPQHGPEVVAAMAERWQQEVTPRTGFVDYAALGEWLDTRSA